MSVFASCLFLFFFFKQKTAYEMRISDWSSDVCSSDLPCMVPADTPIAHVDGVFNAVAAAGDYVGPVLFEGRGAGSNPTASAVVADLADLAAGRHAPAFGVPAVKLHPLKDRKSTRLNSSH